ncbi:MAG: glycosyltransferase family 4 protein [Ignavibacteria bacterium]|nr:glycosyltransferase family 4 protein [Ignavibacteria bacterium]
MKILYSCLSKSWGGMEMFTLTAVHQLLKRNIEVELLCFENSRLHKEAEKQKIIFHTLKASGYFHPVQSFKLSRLIDNNNFNLIHTQASKDLWVLVPALKIIGSKIPLFLTKQVGSFIVKKDILHRWVYNRVTYALAISEVIKRNLMETCPLTEDKILLLHNAVDTKKFDPEKINKRKVRNELGLADDEIVIGMLARFSSGQGHEEFLFAAEKLSKKFSGLKFFIVGEASRGEEVYANQIKKLAADYNLKNVIFAGFRSDTPEVLAALDIFCFPSHSEAFGIALVEAMAMGVPSVCSNSDGILDIAIDGETSFLFEKQNGNDLAEKLERLISSKEKREQFGKASRGRAVKFFDLDYLTEKVISIYEQTLKEKS